MIFSQGDIIKIENIKPLIVVVSKKTFNSSGMIIGCPFIESDKDYALHIPITIDGKSGYVYCESLRTFDLKNRGHKPIGKLTTIESMEVADAVQSIFDYIYP